MERMKVCNWECGVLSIGDETVTLLGVKMRVIVCVTRDEANCGVRNVEHITEHCQEFDKRELE